LHLAGRIAPWINVGGIKVDPVEVRRVLTGIPGVFDAAVSAARGPRGEVVAAVIATAPGACLTRQDVIAHCRQALAEFKIPRQIRLVPAAEMDGTGKLPSPSH
jgi:acyl-CoA synthetase (AMP-forming)/AMP-acid ligase II